MNLVYRKDENYPKVFLKKIIHNFFWKKVRFGALEVPLEM